MSRHSVFRARHARALGVVAIVLGGLVVTAPAATAAAPVISSFSPTSATLGKTVTLTGSGFSGATQVSFGSVAATSPTVVSNTKITVKVPTTAASGLIAVRTAGGTARSGAAFIV